MPEVYGSTMVSSALQSCSRGTVVTIQTSHGIQAKEGCYHVTPITIQWPGNVTPLHLLQIMVTPLQPNFAYELFPTCTSFK